MTTWPILSVVTFLPLVGALFCLVVQGPKEAVDRNCRSAALITSLVTFLVSLLLWVHFDPTKAGFQFEEKVAWIPALNIGCLPPPIAANINSHPVPRISATTAAITRSQNVLRFRAATRNSR